MELLPLFPLHSVLFPGMPIRLQVFENRYLDMIQICMDQDLPFGVVLIKEGMEALGPLPIPHEIGCLTSIQRLQSLDDGRINLFGKGVERIEILEVIREEPYLQAVIRERPLNGTEDPAALQLAQLVQPLLARYLVEFAALRDRSIDPPELPSHPLRLAYLACRLLQVPSGDKQSLLSEESAARLLHGLHQILKQEIPLLRMMRRRGMLAMIGSFGLN